MKQGLPAVSTIGVIQVVIGVPTDFRPTLSTMAIAATNRPCGVNGFV